MGQFTFLFLALAVGVCWADAGANTNHGRLLGSLVLSNSSFPAGSFISNLEELPSGSELSTDLSSEDYTEQPGLSDILTVVKYEDIIAVPENAENDLTEGSDTKKEQSRPKRQIFNDHGATYEEILKQLNKEFTKVSSGLPKEHMDILTQAEKEMANAVSNLPKEHRDLLKQLEQLPTKILSGQFPVEHRGIGEDEENSHVFKFNNTESRSGSSQLSPMLSLSGALLFVGLT